MSAPTLKTLTLGCKVNQYETEYLRQGLARLGYREAGDGEPADLCIVNTCAVTARAEAKSRKAIRHFARHNRQAEIVVMGCYATLAAEQLAAMPGVVEVITDKRQLGEFLARRGLADVPGGIATFGDRHRAYVKVQDGCNMRCSYCIIPYCRRELISRPAEDVLDEIGRLVANGHREIVLVGIHLGHYGAREKQVGDCPDFPAGKMGLSPSKTAAIGDGKSPDLARLVRRIAQLEGEFRLRISSIEAAEVTDELIAVMADRGDRICPHLHLSMQSGSDAVLRRMNRRYSAGEFIARCEQIRSKLDNPALTTDVMVGFPGETEADFLATCRVVEEVGFSKVHVFRFSPRQGTPAADMPDQVPEALKRRRAGGLSALAGRLRRGYFQTLLGQELQILVERRASGAPGVLLGTSARYAPVELPGSQGLIGRLVSATAEAEFEGRIRVQQHVGDEPQTSRPPAVKRSCARCPMHAPR